MMSWRAVSLYNHRKTTYRNLEVVLRKALKLHPANDHALMAMDDAVAGLEMMELDRAIFRNKMHKAYTIASKSEHDQVRARFFASLGELVTSVDEADITPQERLLILEDLRGWCVRMDQTHPLVGRIDTLLRRTELQRS